MTAIDDVVIARRLRRLAPLLAAADAPAPRLVYPAVQVMEARRRQSAARWRLAASLVLLAAAGSVAQPVRAWVVAGARAVWSAFHPATAANAPASPAALPPAHASVSFVPAPGRFAIRIATRQASGTLTVRFVADSAITATAAGGAGSWLVAESGITLNNQAAGTASVLIEVPAAARAVTVQIGAEPPLERSGSFTVSIGNARAK